jgi:hypothetical protein
MVISTIRASGLWTIVARRCASTLLRLRETEEASAVLHQELSLTLLTLLTLIDRVPGVVQVAIKVMMNYE